MAKSNEYVLTILLVFSVISLIFINYQIYGPIEVKTPTNVQIDSLNGIVRLNSLTLKQKLAQMVVVTGHSEERDNFNDMLVGGVYFGAMESKEYFESAISNYKVSSIIPPFITVDLEGCWNPFSKFQKFPALKDITSAADAYNVGYEEGIFMKSLGVNMDFAPVVDIEDNIWKCRCFTGTLEEKSLKIESYINGLQDAGVIATSKHYPGKTLSSNDPHSSLAYATVNSDDLRLFDVSIGSNVGAIMISHLLVDGVIKSGDKPVTVSSSVISFLKSKYSGLIISDDAAMLGLKNHYVSKEQMYIDLFKAGNDIVIDLGIRSKELDLMLDGVVTAVENGEILLEQIDESVMKILTAKGLKVE